MTYLRNSVVGVFSSHISMVHVDWVKIITSRTRIGYILMIDRIVAFSPVRKLNSVLASRLVRFLPLYFTDFQLLCSIPFTADYPSGLFCSVPSWKCSFCLLALLFSYLRVSWIKNETPRMEYEIKIVKPFIESTLLNKLNSMLMNESPVMF